MFAQFFLLMLILSAACTIGLGIYSRRYAANPATLPYQILMYILAFWSLNYVLELSATSLSLKIFWQETRFIFTSFIAVLELWLILAYLNRDAWIRGWRRIALCIIPVITVFLALTSRYHTFFRYGYSVNLTGPLPTLHFTNGPWYQFYIIYTYILILTSLLLLILVRERTPRTFLIQRTILIIALILPSFSSLLFEMGFNPIPGVNITSSLFLIVGILYAIALFRYGFLDIIPIARSRVIEEMSMPMIVLNASGKIVDMNPAASTLLGDFAHSGIGNTICEMAYEWPGLTRFCSSPGNNREELIKPGISEEQVFDARSEVFFSPFGVPEGSLITLTDITVQKKLEHKIRESEERWRSIVDGAPFPIVITRISDNTIMLVNQRTVKQFNISSQELMGSTTDRFYVDLNARAMILAQLKDHDTLDDVEISMHSHDGRLFWVYASIRKIQYLDQDAFFISFADFTQRKKLEDILREKNDTLEQVSQSLAETNKKLSLLSGITRHDILNEIQIIEALTGFLGDTIREPAQQKQINMITNAGRKIQALIEFTREYQDLGQTTPVWQDITRIMRSPIITGLIPRIPIIVSTDPIEVFADPLLVKVFFNLVENSVRHGDNLSYISVSAETDGTDLSIVYEDDGPGVAAPDKERIFERGYGKNTGLGLFFIREILGITGMTIRECGIPGEGVRFEIRVPRGNFR